ncbi:hypothetical protein [Williamsia sp. 1135]|uniref:hypothetical protein n=1 Tax=Williamsia sp. 1135 TaxID=1889262 RepID=UPI00117C08B3|nr:hypothetical protein [Williamsia sp. 1135]
MTGRRQWLQWVDEVSGHRLIELSPCPGTDGADSACALFADHGGPHRFVPTSSTLKFGTHYEPETTVSRNGSSRGGSVVTARESAAPVSPQRHATEQPRVSVPESAGEQVGTGRRSRHLDDTQQVSEDQTPQIPTPSAPGTARPRRAADRTAEAVPTVDEALLAVAEALAELARAIRRRDDTG